MGKPLVDVIASGYEWTCPECGTLNREIEARENYNCSDCNLDVRADGPEHCFG